MFNRLSTLTINSALFARFAALLEGIGRQRPGLLSVLTYHRVDKLDASPGLYPGLISATPEAFEQQMRYLATCYQVISISDVLDAAETRRTLPPRSVLITFDDAYQDFAKHAWPVLKHYRLPVALFVPTAFPDHVERTFWWDRLYHALATTPGREWVTPAGPVQLETTTQRLRAFKHLKEHVKSRPHAEAMAWVEQACRELSALPPTHSVLGWATLRQLAREGVTLGAHTRTHPLMNRISPEEAQAEAIGSLQDLEREIGSVLPIFAYPGGGFTDKVVEALKHQGFALAFTTQAGVNDWKYADRLRLRRVNVSQRTNLAVLQLRLSRLPIHRN